MRKNKLTKRLRNLGFSEEIIAIFDVFRDFFGFEPVVLPGKYFGITIFFKCKNVMFTKEMMVTENNVGELEKTILNRMRNGRLFSISTNNNGKETTWSVPPFSTAKELKMKLQLSGFAKGDW